MKIRNDARDAHIVALFTSGDTMQTIGSQFGISRERVRTILSTNALIGRDGGAAKRVRLAHAEHLQAREHRCHYRWGHGLAAHQKLVQMDPSPVGAFVQQRQSAKNRGIIWELTLDAWWQIWQRSGHWTERGKGHNHYVMSRFGDTGPYCAENVFIQLAPMNNSVRREKRSGLPIGVRRVPSGHFVALKMRNGRTHYLGTYTTTAEAAAAYEHA